MCIIHTAIQTAVVSNCLCCCKCYVLRVIALKLSCSTYDTHHASPDIVIYVSAVFVVCCCCCVVCIVGVLWRVCVFSRDPPSLSL